jgi:hypothetical protein
MARSDVLSAEMLANATIDDLVVQDIRIRRLKDGQRRVLTSITLGPLHYLGSGDYPSVDEACAAQLAAALSYFQSGNG